MTGFCQLSYFFPYLCSVCTPSIVRTPENAAAAVGSTVSFDCVTNDSSIIVRWDYCQSGENIVIYTGFKVTARFIGRLSVDKIVEEADASTASATVHTNHRLTVASASLSDSGQYICFQSTKPIFYSALLTVVGENFADSVVCIS